MDRDRPGAVRGTPKAWFYGIARTLVANDRRRSDRKRAREARFRGSALLDEEDAARMDARIDAAAQGRHLYAAMDRLGEGERAVLGLRALLRRASSHGRLAGATNGATSPTDSSRSPRSSISRKPL